MSAFIVSDDHISALVTFAVEHRVIVYGQGLEITRGNAEEVGRILLDENVASVGYRYRGEINTGEKNAAAAYRYVPYSGVSAVQIIKACDSLDYQSCEHDGWETSRARSILRAIKAAAIRALPGYETAEWGVPARPAREAMSFAAPKKLTPAQKAWATRKARR